ncbi:MAG: phosphonatase-like hydrolase [Proteobacteria bacterium]|nr:phosphonatase-like hydrolase [Pseudomonadota bacterium]
MHDVSLVVFDMAGTTIEDSGQVPEAFTAVLRANGIQISAAELSSLRGASKRDAIRHFVAAQGGADVEVRTDSIFAGFRAHLSGLFRAGGVKPVEGAAETFAWLRARGARVALNTGFDRMITDLIVEYVGWDSGTVDAIVCGDDVSRGRPAPDLIHRAMQLTGVTDARRVISVGDTVLDLQAGNNAGAGWVIGVLSGAHGRAQLETEPHTCLVESVADLPRLLEQYAIA